MLGSMVHSTEGHLETGGNPNATGESGQWINDSNISNLSRLIERRIINQ